MAKRKKAILVDEDLWEMLMVEKAKRRCRSVGEVLRQLLNMPPPGESEGESGEGGEGAPAPQLKQPPKPAKLVSGSWGFCPECLSIYTLEQAECPKCGVLLVSLMDEEGKELYRRLKAEKRQ